MKIYGIICEYNPLHLGHKKQLDLIKQENGAIVCLMSGNFVQRGQPAIIDKMARAKAAVDCGADLVLELPVTAALSSAEGFAAGGVNILGKFCDHLSFGAENADAEKLMETAHTLLSAEFTEKLRTELDKGLSFPAARQQALGQDGDILATPNNILGVEYCKAIISGGHNMTIAPIQRTGSYHDTLPHPTEPSATAVRQLMGNGDSWQAFVPEQAVNAFKNANLHHISYGERAILSKLRTMTDEEFEKLPFGSEGLWRKLMHESRRQATLEEILSAVKSKRYTRTRLDRMVMCAYLGITEEMLQNSAPYVRVLGFNDTGREILKKARNSGEFVNIGQETGHEYEALEHRCTDLYGLFAQALSPAGLEQESRVYYKR